MNRIIRNFNSFLVLLVLVISVQLLLLPFYHFHPDQKHSHSVELPSHQHIAYFHSIELDNIAHLTHSHDHSSVDRNSQHSDNSGEDSLKIELSNETLKSKSHFKILKVFSFFSPLDDPKEHKTNFLIIKLHDFSDITFQNKLRERSPPFLSI
jgi:hypothetical protein